MRRSVGLVTLIASFALLLGACGGGKGVGSDLGDVKGGTGEGAIGQATTTVPEVTTAAPTVTTAKPTATTAAAIPAASFSINADTKGQYIDPLNNAIHLGQFARFTNQDTISHQLTLRLNGQNTLQSPSIAPGGTWDAKPTIAGAYEVIDEQRPYASGVTLTVSR